MRQAELPEDDKEARCNEKYRREKVHDAKGTLGPSDENGVEERGAEGSRKACQGEAVRRSPNYSYREFARQHEGASAY